MARQSSRHLNSLMNRRVRCWLDKPERTEEGVLIGLHVGGPRVRFDDGRERTVAAWRISAA